jgi:hypothetical protein
MNLHRMRHALSSAALALAFSLIGFATPAHAALLNANPPQTFPDISSDIVGQLNYTYDPSSKVGTLDVTNAPSILAAGPTASQESFIFDNGSQTRQQSLQVQLDSSGNIVAGSGNTFSMTGSVTVGGQTYSGVLLQGTPIAFGWQPTQTPPIGSSAFDVEVKLTGGLLQSQYGADAYIQLTPELNSTFANSFTANFSAEKAVTNVRPLSPSSPSAVPEPSMFAILLVCGGAAAVYRKRCRHAA